MSPVEITPEFNPLRLPSDRRLNRIAGPSSLIIFGVTGDLSRKKLMPAVYDLANRGLLPPGFALVGFARRDWIIQDFARRETDQFHYVIRPECAKRAAQMASAFEVDHGTGSPRR